MAKNTSKRNVTEKELLEATFNPPDININEAFTPESAERVRKYNEWKKKKVADEEAGKGKK